VNGDATFMPSADINTAGSIGVNYGESGSSTFWSMEVSEKISTDTGFETPVQVATGVARSSDSRIGDFSATTVDPADGLTFWGANEYQGSDFWDTHLASFHSSTGGASTVHRNAVASVLASTNTTPVSSDGPVSTFENGNTSLATGHIVDHLAPTITSAKPNGNNSHAAVAAGRGHWAAKVDELFVGDSWNLG
jgi:hypothetical protein